ncbi:hypothetical protein QTO34_009964 [Cnephaeus nilssonii]|uniref:Uncharacterized protein n=1 Tax=Cnephaeus nilssonii TaxID=3371016 RepID=A0AA40HFL3_CNENI|nr:hypothetical protein QTO34_009964 [Eptesicus nilssonii]
MWQSLYTFLTLIREFTQVRSLINVENVANPLADVQNLLHSREILERSLLNVESVTKLLSTVLARCEEFHKFLTSSENLLTITEFSLQKSLMNVKNVKKALKSHSGIIVFERLPNRQNLQISKFTEHQRFYTVGNYTVENVRKQLAGMTCRQCKFQGQQQNDRLDNLLDFPPWYDTNWCQAIQADEMRFIGGQVSLRSIIALQMEAQTTCRPRDQSIGELHDHHKEGAPGHQRGRGGQSITELQLGGQGLHFGVINGGAL